MTWTDRIVPYEIDEGFSTYPINAVFKGIGKRYLHENNTKLFYFSEMLYADIGSEKNIQKRKFKHSIMPFCKHVVAKVIFVPCSVD